MSNKTYDVLKQIAGIWLPMVCAILIGIGEIWGVPVMTPIGATLTLVDGALGVALEKISKDYHYYADGDERYED